LKEIKMMKLDSACWAKATFFGVLLSVACTSVKNGGGGADGSVDTGGGGASGGNGTGGGSSASGGASGGGKGGAGAAKADAGDGGSANGGDTGTGGTGTGGTTAAPGRGAITITQSAKPDHYGIEGGFNSFGGLVGTAVDPANCTTTSTCSVCVIPVTDAGVPAPRNGLDDGAISVTGVGASKATLTYGPIAHTTISSYSQASGDAPFFKGGDAVSVSSVGGADLPAFGAETVTAPSDIVLTAPACAAVGCDGLDRTKDLQVTWTGGGAGTLEVIIETVATDAVAEVTCNFDAKTGAGTVPSSMLVKLGNSDIANISGVETFIATNKKDFTVGDIPTTFSLDVDVAQGLLTVVK
jgi:hypothetical protein